MGVLCNENREEQSVTSEGGEWTTLFGGGDIHGGGRGISGFHQVKELKPWRWRENGKQAFTVQGEQV